MIYPVGNTFDKLIDFVNTLLDENPDAPMVFAAETENGETVGFAYAAEHGTEESKRQEEEFIASLADTPVILRTAAVWNDGTPDMMSRRLWEGIIALAPENGETLHLLMGRELVARRYDDMK
ncbi:MAG: hypothetical protein K6F68_06720 [Clostridiales bacterium]|nr:hypothetical protein [Clostridiales bacterium]